MSVVFEALVNPNVSIEYSPRERVYSYPYAYIRVCMPFIP